MDVTVVSELYGPWTLFTLFVIQFLTTIRVSLKTRTLSIKKKVKQKKGKSETTLGYLISGFGFEYKSA